MDLILKWEGELRRRSFALRRDTVLTEIKNLFTIFSTLTIFQTNMATGHFCHRRFLVLYP